jgi:hypothetical protein
MAVFVTVRLNHPEIVALLTDRAYRIGRRVHRLAQAYAPRESGRLASSLFVTAGTTGAHVFADVGTFLPYGLYQHEGTGVYAGRGMIRARPGKVMRFRPGRAVGPLRAGESHPPASARGWVYARAVKGVPPNPFLVQALNDVVGGVARVQRIRVRGR